MGAEPRRVRAERLRAALKVAILEFQPDDSLSTEGCSARVRKGDSCDQPESAPRGLSRLRDPAPGKSVGNRLPESRMKLFSTASTSRALEVTEIRFIGNSTTRSLAIRRKKTLKPIHPSLGRAAGPEW